MSIESLGLNRPAAAPAGRRAPRAERRGTFAPPPERRFDAAEVRGGRPQPPRGADTEIMLGKLHERGLVTSVSRPLGQEDGSVQTAEEFLTNVHDSINRMPVLRRMPDEMQAAQAPDPARPDMRERYDERTVRMRDRDIPRGEPMGNSPMDGRIYGRPRPQPPRGAEGARQDNGVFTIKLYSPKEDTGKTLRIGSHTIPLEEDGSILAEMPDGSMRRITFDQDVMDEMVARGEVWMEGDQPAGPRRAEADPLQDPPPTNAQEQYAGVARQIFNRQAKEAAEAGVWDAPNGWKAGQPRPVMAKYNISATGGMWGAKRITERMLAYAKQVTGNDPSQIEDLKAAMKRGIADVEEAWGGEVPDVARETYDSVVKALDEWAAESRDNGAGHAVNNAGTVAVQLANGDEKAENKQDDAKASDGAESGSVRGKGNPALVSQLKADLERRQAQMLDMVRDMLSKQGKKVSGNGIWRTLASGNFQVDAATRAEAQKNIAEDGYWGVEQTSDRIVQFAVGLAGSSPEMLNKMEEAFEKGYAAAEKKWGGALPGISQQTRARVHEKFEELRKQQDRNSGEISATIHLSARTVEEETER